jgi:acyl-CoA synthetase (AMP-forming)/AMP-acid ligase II
MVAIRRPERIEKLVYLNTTLTETEALPPLIKTAAKPFIGRILTQYTSRFITFTTQWGVAKRLSPDVKDWYYYPYRTRARRQAIWDFVADIPFDRSHPTYRAMLDLAEGIPQLESTPVKIIWGLKDPCFHRQMLSKVAAHFPQAEVVEIPDASHLVLEDAPEIAIPAVAEFLTRDRGSAMQPANAAVQEERTVHAVYAGFLRMAARFPQHHAVVVPRWVRDSINDATVHYSQVTYAELARRVYQYQRGLNKLGLAPGDRVLMLVTPGTDFLALALAVMGRGAAPVFVDPGIGFDRLVRCIQDCAPHAFIGSPRAHLLRLVKRRIFKNMKFNLTVSEWPIGGRTTLGYLKRFSSAPVDPVSLPVSREGSRSRDVAMVAFTSGATGTPKGVVFTNGMLEEQIGILGSVFGQRAESLDMPLLPIFSLYNVALGVGSVFVPLPPGRPLDHDPERVCRALSDLSVESCFGSPALWTKLGEYCVRAKLVLPKLRRVFMAGAPVSKSVLDVVKRAVPNGESYTPYGATEALPITLISGTELLTEPRTPAVTGDLGVLVGKPLPGIELKIIEHSEKPIRNLTDARVVSEPRKIGEIIVRAKNVSPEYLHRPDANLKGKIADAGTVWHRMGDLGYLDERGSLYFCGRGVHSVFCEKGTFHSGPVEDLFNEHPKVRRSALVRVAAGTEPGVVIEPEPDCWPESDEDRARFIEELRTLAQTSPLTSPIEKFWFHRSLPVDPRHNAKIFRDQLSVWVDAQLSPGSELKAA